MKHPQKSKMLFLGFANLTRNGKMGLKGVTEKVEKT